MGIVQAPAILAGQVGVIGAIKYMTTTDNLATITAAGYLNNIDLAVNPIFSSDVLGITYSYNLQTNKGTFGLFTVSLSNGVITLVQYVAPGNVLLPVVSGDFAVFNGTTGQIKDAGYLPSNAAKTNVVMANGATILNHIGVFTDTAGTLGIDATTAINGGNIQAGLSGTAGTLASFPAASSKGSLVVAAVANTGNTNTTISNAAMGQASVISIPDPGGATADFALAPAALVNGNLIKASGTAGLIADAGFAANTVAISTITSPDAQSDIIWYDITASAAALATAGKVNVQVSSGSKQYKVRNVLFNYGAAGLSGGGGDRLLALTDGTTVYNNAGITAALLGTPVNTVWGGSGNPLPGTVAMNTSTAAGANLYFQYTGGTTDYTTGSVVISVQVQRVV